MHSGCAKAVRQCGLCLTGPIRLAPAELTHPLTDGRIVISCVSVSGFQGGEYSASRTVHSIITIR